MCSCFNICVMTVFQQRANVFFLSTTTTKKRKVFYFWCLHVFWSWSLQTILRRFCLPISFYFFWSSLIFSKGYLPWEVSVILWKRMGVQFLLRFFVQSFLSFSRVVVGHRHRLMTLKGIGLGLHMARFHVAKCFWFLLPGCCCVSVMQVDVRYCLKPLMIGFALKWATSFAVFSIPL